MCPFIPRRRRHASGPSLLNVSTEPMSEISDHIRCLAVGFLDSLPSSLSITQFYHDIVSQSFEVVFPQSPQDTANINSKQHYNYLLPSR